MNIRHLTLAALAGLALSATATVRITRPSVEGLDASVTPRLGLDVATPRLGWQLTADADEHDVRQTSYHIRVATHPDTLAAGHADLWDQKVDSPQSLWIDYQGLPLAVNQRAYWQVQVSYTSSATKRGRTQTTAWSDVACWGAGLYNEGNWRGYWIGLDRAMPWDVEDVHSSLSARYYRTVFDTRGKQVRHATLHIAGLGLYEAYVNGNRVGAAPQKGSHVGKQVLAPAPTDYRRSIIYNSYDVTQQIAQHNCLAVTVSGGRYYTMQQKKKLYKIANFGYPTLRANLIVEYTDGTSDVIVTNEKAWRMTADGPIRKSNEYDGETYDANLVWATPDSKVADRRLHWTLAEYDDSQWPRPERSAIPIGTMRGNTTPPMQVQEILRPTRSRLTADGRLMLDFAQNFAGWMRVPVGLFGLQEGDTLVMRFAEKLEAPIGLPWTEQESAQSNGPGYCLTDTSRLYLDNLRQAEVTDRYIASGRETTDQTWAPRFTYHGFRFAEVTVHRRQGAAAKRLTDRQRADIVARIEGEVVGDPMETLYTFRTPNELLNRIIRNAFWGIRSNFKGMPVDCPQRDERQPWVGDHSMGCWGESYMMDVHALYLKWMQDLEDSQRPDGSLPGVAPAFWNYYNDDVSWPSVFLFGADMLYTQFGDVEAIRRHYPAMRRWVMHFWNERRDAKTGIIHADKYADWCCPPEAPELIHSQDPNRVTDGDLIGSCYLYKMFELMMRFDDVLVQQQQGLTAQRQRDDYARQGLTADVLQADRAEYEAIRAELRDTINRQFLVDKRRADDPQAGRAPNTMTAPGNHILYPDSVYYSNNSVTANLLPLAFGIVPDDLASTVERWVIRKHLLLPGDTPELKSVDGHIQCGVIGMSWLLRGLADMGRQDVAYMLATVASYPGWGYMANRGATTIWELWNGDTANPRMNSGNHIMLLGDLIPWCIETIGGISAAAPGYGKVRLAPRFELDQLPWAEASYRTPYGLVSSHWQISDRELIWRIDVPCNTTAEVVLPYNAKSFRTAGARKATALTANTITLGSGHHELTVTLDPALPVRDYYKGGAYERQWADSLAADRHGIVADEFLYDWTADGTQPGLAQQTVTPFPSCHSATIAELPNGDLLSAFFGGSREGGPDVCIYTARKARGEQGWQPLQLVANGDLRDDATLHHSTPIDSACTSPIVINQNRKACYNPVLFQIPGGDLLLFYKIGKNVKDWTGYLMRSSDGGHTWRGQRQRLVPAPGQTTSDGKPLPADSLLGAIKNQPVWLPAGFRCANGTVLKQGRIVAPTSKEDGKWRSYMEISDDQGETWQLVGPIPAASHIKTIQPAILVHPDGRLQILCRTAKPKFEKGDRAEWARIATAWSEDGGMTWSPFELLTDLPNNNSGIGAVTLPDGTFALVYNPFAVVDGPDKPLRNPTCIATSTDGLHWQHRLTLESSPISQYSYPSLLLGSDGTLHAIYTWRRQCIKYQQIRLK